VWEVQLWQPSRCSDGSVIRAPSHAEVAVSNRPWFATIPVRSPGSSTSLLPTAKPYPHWDTVAPDLLAELKYPSETCVNIFVSVLLFAGGQVYWKCLSTHLNVQYTTILVVVTLRHACQPGRNAVRCEAFSPTTSTSFFFCAFRTAFKC